MAVTEAAPLAATAAADDTAPAPGGLAALLGSVDHLTVGRLFLASSLVLLILGRVAGILVDVERIDTATTSVLDEVLGPVFSAHLAIDLFLFLVPAFLGIAIAVVPLQIGATTVAFPRAAAAAFWTWLLSSGVLVASYFIDGGPPGLGTDTDGILLWTVGMGGSVAGLLLATVCVLTTVLTLRTAGMSVDRVPTFTWAMFVSGVVWLVSLPVLLAILVLTYLDVDYGAGLGAGDHLGWVFGAPQVFAFALPALGVLLDVVAVAAGVRLRSRGVFLALIGLAGVLTFGAELLDPGQADASVFQDFLYIAAAFALLVPLLGILGGVGDTLRRGTLRLSASLLLALSSLLLLLAAAIVNAIRVIDAFDLVGTSADAAVRELVVVAGLLGVAGACAYWATKLFGAPLKEGLGRLAALVLLLGGVLVGLPDLISGFLDQPDGVAALPSVEDGVEALNAVTVAGGVLVLAGVLLMLLNLTVGRSSDGEAVLADPWDGHTLEWATGSPPAPGGPGPIAPVTSATPLLDAKEGAS